MGSTRDEGEVLQVFRRGGKRPGDLAWRREREAKICSHPISFPAQVFNLYCKSYFCVLWIIFGDIPGIINFALCPLVQGFLLLLFVLCIVFSINSTKQ